MPLLAPQMQSEFIVHTLNRFEANLLSILYAVLGDTSIGLVMPKINQEQKYRGCLSRATIELVQATLAKGVTHWLASQGGWINDRYMRGESVASGPVWQRTDPRDLGLTFSAASLQFLIWITANDPLAESADPWRVLPDDLTPGDQLLLLLTLQRLNGTQVADRWFVMRKFARLPLIALCFPAQVAARQRQVVPDFAAQLPALAGILECLQPYLLQRCIDVETSKAFMSEASEIIRFGTQQTALLTAFMEAAAQRGRRDLARFLLVALQRLVTTDIAPEQWARRWIGGLRLGDMRLAERTIVYQAASSFLTSAARLQAWAEECRQVGYFDEGYAAAQLWLADWARYDGEHTTQRAAAMVRSLSV